MKMVRLADHRIGPFVVQRSGLVHSEWRARGVSFWIGLFIVASVTKIEDRWHVLALDRHIKIWPR